MEGFYFYNFSWSFSNRLYLSGNFPNFLLQSHKKTVFQLKQFEGSRSGANQVTKFHLVISVVSVVDVVAATAVDAVAVVVVGLVNNIHLMFRLYYIFGLVSLRQGTYYDGFFISHL